MDWKIRIDNVNILYLFVQKVNSIEMDVRLYFVDVDHQNVDIDELLIEYYYRILNHHKQDTRGNQILINNRRIFSSLLDFENLHNQIKVNFYRVFDHNISIELVYMYVLKEEKDYFIGIIKDTNQVRLQDLLLQEEKTCYLK
jgi:hypothetical protein